MPNTPIYGWPYQALGVAPDGPNLGEDLALAIEATVAAIQADLDAAESDIDALPRGIIAHHKRITNSTTTTTEQGVIRIDDVPIEGGRTYLIHTSSLAVDGSVANDVIRSTIRYTTDGSTPTTSSGALTFAQDLQPNVASAVFVAPRCSYTPSVDETLSVLLTVSRSVGTGTVGMLANSGLPIEIFIEDMGVDVGDTGVDI
jgi:Chitobiase/beta-hexosaminidase C-terminal domain